MSTQKKQNSPRKKCVFVGPEVIDLSQSDEETLIDIDTRSNEVSAETITADDIRAMWEERLPGRAREEPCFFSI